MNLLQELRLEHRLIERVLGALRSYALRLSKGEAVHADGFALLQFLETYAGDWHHAREEEVLFRALNAGAGLPFGRGPIAVMLADHEQLSRSVKALRRTWSDGDRAEFEQVACAYVRLLSTHIDAENSVLFPESELHLRRNRVLDLPLRAMRQEVHDAAVRAEILISRYGE
jgi:hemerythrin-like domain-containing protein